MMHGGPSGFHNAPVTRTLVISGAIITVTSGLCGRSCSIGLAYQDIIQNYSLWKTVPSIFAFSSSPELIIGLYLIYYFRVFERQIGSNKYSVFVLFNLVASTFFQIVALGLLKVPQKVNITIFMVIFVVSKFILSSANIRRNAHISNINHQVQRNNRSVGNFTPEPSESSIATLASMGFESNAARQALFRARNDVNVATNILLEALLPNSALCPFGKCTLSCTPHSYKKRGTNRISISLAFTSFNMSRFWYL